MSHWYEPKLEDYSLSEDGKELDILIGSDHGGNIYLTLKLEDIKKILEL